MRFEWLKLRGLIPFPGEVELDLTALPGQIVALVGPNGAGKSTLLESLVGALSRETPTRGPLTQLATTRDSLVEARVVNGKSWTISHRIDAVSGKSESRVTGADGSTPMPDTKVRSFDEWAARTLPDPGVLLASTFACQAGGGLLRMSPTERKATILRAIGIDKLEGYVADAREWARHVEGRLGVVLARLADEKARGGDVDAAHRALAQAEDALHIAEVEAQNADVHVDAMRADAARIAQENAAAQAARAELSAAREAARIARERAEASAQQLATLDRELAQADAIRAAADRTAAIDEELRPLREKLAATRAEENAASRRSIDAIAACSRARSASDHAKAKLEEARRAAGARDAAIAEAARLPEAQKALDAAIADVTAAEAKLAGLRALQLNGADKRASELRVAVDFYVDESDGGHRARVASVEDERLKLALAKLPADLAEAEEMLRRARSTAGAAQSEVSRLDQQRIRAEGPDPVVSAAEAAAAATKAHEEAIAAAEAAQSDDDRLRLGIVDLVAMFNKLTTERAGLAPMAEQSAGLVAAEARKAALTEKLEADRAELQAADRRLGSIDEAALPAEQPPPDVAGAERIAREMAMQVAEKRARLEAAQAALARAQESAAIIEQLSTERASLEQELSDWLREAADLTAIIAMEVDGLGPTLTEIANDLLHTCVGSRFTVSIETQRASADGKKTLETCEIRVLDTEDGTWKLGERLSGGQAVLVGEAVSLALAVVACRYWGVEGPTLVRDESGASLDAGMAPRYVAMLRRAGEAIGASRVLIVTHDQDVQALCDARVVVGGGKVEVHA